MIDVETSLERRTRAAEKYRPERIRLLLVAEAPPGDEARYFYFEDVQDHDSLFRYVVRGILGVEPTRDDKANLLEALKQAGVFLIDASPEPIDPGTSLDDQVDPLVSRCRDLQPEAIILIKVTVYDAAFHALRRNGLPVVDERIPFPGSGQQLRFEAAFARALAKIER